MINPISQQKIAFTGKSFNKIPYSEELCSKARDIIARSSDCCDEKLLPKNEVLPETFQAYANITYGKNADLIRRNYGYQARDNSIELPVYTGPKNKSAGFSTEVCTTEEARSYGGGWLKASIDTPLSTSDIYTCAAFNLVNEAEGEHFLFHVHHKTKAEDIRSLILEKFPRFNKVNIIPGEMFKTVNTVDSIISAVDKTNPNAEKNFYHFPTLSPEVVAHKGTLSYVQDRKPKTVTFQEVDQYFYDSSDLV